MNAVMNEPDDGTSIVAPVWSDHHGRVPAETTGRLTTGLLGRGQLTKGARPSRSRTSGRRSGGTVFGGWRRAGRPASSCSVMSATSSARRLHRLGPARGSAW